MTAAKDLTGGFLAALKRRGQVAEANATRGSIYARVMVAARDSRLSGAEWSVLVTIALHLQHQGRSRGLMTLESLADDCIVTERTVRNALKTLVAAKFVVITPRSGGRFTLMLAPRFKRNAVVPGNAAPPSKRRSAPRKKISTTGTPRLRRVVPATDQCTDSAAKGRRESPGAVFQDRTAQQHDVTDLTDAMNAYMDGMNAAARSFLDLMGVKHPAYDWPDHGPPRKRASPGPSG